MKVLVVGGSGGIGGAVLRLLKKSGHEAVFTYHSNAAAAEALEKAAGAKKLRYDLSSAESIAALCEHVAGASYDGLVYAAAEKFPRETLLKTDAKKFLDYLDRSLDGYYQVSRAFALAAKNRKGSGVIVNLLSSVVSGAPPAKQACYVAAKYALLGLTRCQAVEFGEFGVRVNSVSPGMTRTDFNSDLPERFLEIYAESLPMKRLLRPEEVAQTVCFLFSNEAVGIRGRDLPVPGGPS